MGNSINAATLANSQQDFMAHWPKKRATLSVLGSALATFWSGALIFGFPGVFIPTWQKMFNVGNAETGLIMTFVIVSLGIFTFFAGAIHAKLGTRKCYLIGTVMLVVAMLILTYAQNIYMVYIWAFLNGASSCFVYSPSLATVQNWFPHKRGLVTGIVNLIFGISAAIMSPLFHLMFTALGYIPMNLIVIGMLLITNLVATLLAEVPQRTHLKDAEREAHQSLMQEVKSTNAASGQSMEDIHYKDAVKTKSFWMIWLTWCFMGAAGISMVGLSTKYGASLSAAGLAVSGVTFLAFFNITNGLSRIVAGALSDVIGRNVLGCIAFIASAVGYFILASGVTNNVVLCICMLLVGFAFGTLFAITAPLVTDLYGLKYFGTIFGLIFTAYGFVGGIVGPFLSNIFIDTKGFSFVFTYLGVFCILAAIAVMFARKKTEVKSVGVVK